MPKRVIEEIAKDMAADAIGKKLKRTTGSAWLHRESKVCPYCKVEFLPRMHNQKTCGAEKCKYEHRWKLNRAKTKEAHCVICNATFMRATNKGRNATQTCGKKCSDELRKRNMAKNVLICAKCGKKFSQHGSGSKYCLECGRAPQTCAVCGKAFRSRHIAQKTCGAKECIATHKSAVCKTKYRELNAQQPDTFDIDFSQLHTMNAEFPTMDCPECDPLTNRMFNGVWIETHEQPKRKAA